MSKKIIYATSAQVRASFWASHPHLHCGFSAEVVNKAFADWVRLLVNQGLTTEAVASIAIR
jgi:hypothetical protein